MTLAVAHTVGCYGQKPDFCYNCFTCWRQSVLLWERALPANDLARSFARRRAPTKSRDRLPCSPPGGRSSTSCGDEARVFDFLGNRR